MRGLFVTGTDTGAGKTVLAAAIVAALRARGLSVAAIKPVLTGLAEAPDPAWAPDHELLARVAGCAAERVACLTYEPPVSPHLAARLSDRQIDPAALIECVLRAADGHQLAVIEGVGGLLVPLTHDGYDVRELARELSLPLVIAARPGLGTINHTLLTLEAARTLGLKVASVVLTPWPSTPGEVERSNRETILRLGEVDVQVLGALPAPEPALLAAAGADLPLDRWLAESASLSSPA